MRIACEAVLFTLIYSAWMLLVFRRQGALRQVYNYPPKIRERVIELNLISDAELNGAAKGEQVQVPSRYYEKSLACDLIIVTIPLYPYVFT